MWVRWGVTPFIKVISYRFSEKVTYVHIIKQRITGYSHTERFACEEAMLLKIHFLKSSREMLCNFFKTNILTREFLKGKYYVAKNIIFVMLLFQEV